MTVSFACPECRRVLRLSQAPAAGKKVKCPGCGEVFAPDVASESPATAVQKKPAIKVAPAEVEEEDDDDRPAKSGVTTRPKPRRPRDDDDEDDDRPRRKSVKKPAKAGGAMLLLLLLGGGAVLLLLGGGAITAFVWPGFLRGGGSADNNNPMTFLPAGANMAIGGDVATLRSRGALDKLLESMKKAAKDAGEMDDFMGFEQILKTDADRLLVFANTQDIDKDRNKTAKTVMVILTRAPYDRARMKNLCGVEAEITVPGGTAFRCKASPKTGKPSYMAFAGSKMIVAYNGTEPEFVALLASVKNPAQAPALTELMRNVETGAGWLALSFDQKLRDELARNEAEMRRKSPAGAEIFAKARQGKGLTVRIDWTEGGAPGGAMPPPGGNAGAPKGIKLEASLVCSNDQDAKVVVDQVKATWDKEVKPLLALLAFMPAKDKQTQQLLNVAKEVGNTFAVQQQGPIATASIVAPDSAVELLQNPNLGAGVLVPGGGGRPKR